MLCRSLSRPSLHAGEKDAQAAVPFAQAFLLCSALLCFAVFALLYFASISLVGFPISVILWFPTSIQN